MRFLHTADWQIGMRAAHVGAAGPRVREERFLAARRAMDAARAAGADFVVVAGDVFEDNGVERASIQRVADALAAFGGPVYLVPGNHDPLVPGSVWDHPAWRANPALHVLRDEAPVPVPGGTLYPCVARAKHSASDPTEWIAAHDAPGVRVGLAHGTVAGAHLDEPDYPIARDAPARRGLDYLALGHFHSTASYAGDDGAARVAYSGTHETTRFAERDSGNALVVDIAERGAPPVLTPVRTAGLAWREHEQELREPGALAALRARVDQLEEPETTLLRVRLSGLLPASERDELLHLGEIVETRFLFGRVELHDLRPAPADDAWISALPPGVVREAAARLRALSDPSAPAPRPEGATADAAAWALLELYELAAGERA